MLWTRVTLDPAGDALSTTLGEPAAAVTVDWRIALDPQLEQEVGAGSTTS